MSEDISDSGRRAALMAGTLGTLAFMLSVPRAVRAAAGASLSAQEQAALQLTSDLFSAIASKDVDKIASCVADDIVFKGHPDMAEVRGKSAVVDTIGQFLRGSVTHGLTLATRADSAYAIGGEIGTAVINRRMDYSTRNGKKSPLPLASAFWVAEGKIAAWFEFPLVAEELSPNTAPASR